MKFRKERNEETKSNEYIVSVDDRELAVFKQMNEQLESTGLTNQETMLIEIISKMIANQVVNDINDS